MSNASNSVKQAWKTADNESLEHERTELLQRQEGCLKAQMLVLALAWLALLVGELVWGESPWFEIIGTIIWVVFILNFVAEFALFPHKVVYLKRNLLTAGRPPPRLLTGSENA